MMDEPLVLRQQSGFLVRTILIREHADAYSDITLLAPANDFDENPIKIQLNKAVLAAISPLLRDIISHDESSESPLVMIAPDFSHESLESMSALLYGGEPVVDNMFLAQEVINFMETVGVNVDDLSVDVRHALAASDGDTRSSDYTATRTPVNGSLASQGQVIGEHTASRNCNELLQQPACQHVEIKTEPVDCFSSEFVVASVSSVTVTSAMHCASFAATTPNFTSNNIHAHGGSLTSANGPGDSNGDLGRRRLLSDCDSGDIVVLDSGDQIVDDDDLQVLLSQFSSDGVAEAAAASGSSIAATNSASGETVVGSANIIRDWFDTEFEAEPIIAEFTASKVTVPSINNQKTDSDSVFETSCVDSARESVSGAAFHHCGGQSELNISASGSLDDISDEITSLCELRTVTDRDLDICGNVAVGAARTGDYDAELCDFNANRPPKMTKTIHRPHSCDPRESYAHAERCAQCSIVATDAKQMFEHRVLCRVEQSSPYMCRFCSFYCSDYGAVAAHEHQAHLGGGRVRHQSLDGVPYPHHHQAAGSDTNNSHNHTSEKPGYQYQHHQHTAIIAHPAVNASKSLHNQTCDRHEYQYQNHPLAAGNTFNQSRHHGCEKPGYQFSAVFDEARVPDRNSHHQFSSENSLDISHAQDSGSHCQYTSGSASESSYSLRENHSFEDPDNHHTYEKPLESSVHHSDETSREQPQYTTLESPCEKPDNHTEKPHYETGATAPTTDNSKPSSKSKEVPVQRVRTLSRNSSSGDSSDAHRCEVCCKHYSSRGALLRHKRYECGVQPRFRCNLCTRTFCHNFNLKTHLYWHTKHEAPEDDGGSGKQRSPPSQRPSPQSTSAASKSSGAEDASSSGSNGGGSAGSSRSSEQDLVIALSPSN